MIDEAYLNENINIPKDYFKGHGKYTFPVPSEILLFHRERFGGDLVDIKDDIHYRHVLIINFGEPIKMLIDGEAIELATDSFLIILPYQYHRYYNQNQKKLLLFFITFELSENLFLEQFRNSLFLYNHSYDEDLKKIIQYYKEENDLLLPYLLGGIIIALFHDSSQFPIMNGKENGSQLVHRICKEIYRDKTITINALARKLGFSDRYLRRIFKMAMGITLGHYIQEIKIFEAMKQLAITNNSITEISERIGYDSIYSFSRAFKNKLGVSPREYRHKMFNNKKRFYNMQQDSHSLY